MAGAFTLRLKAFVLQGNILHTFSFVICVQSPHLYRATQWSFMSAQNVFLSHASSVCRQQGDM